MIHSLIDGEPLIDERRLREALAMRLELIERLRDFLAHADAIVTPPATGEAPATLTSTGDASFCTLWTLCGVPAITVPSGRGPNGLPLGTQLIGAPLADSELLATAKWTARVFGELE
jgi:Asp-tRNA(Asn)/Glu-tRNA(Gln) amidotransferase A subunit family amidase